jgi:P-type Cu+ transporter
MSAQKPAELSLPIEGMTCASCVNRIERFLKKTPGVATAAVNLATEKATVLVDPGVAGRDELVRAVEAAGYEVRPEAVVAEGAVAQSLDAELSVEDLERERALRETLRMSAVSIATSLVFMVLMFWPQTVVSMTGINKAILLPATFIVAWAGNRFYRAAWRAGRHGGATMDTQIGRAHV